MNRNKLPQNSREWHVRVWSLTWPVIISNISVPLVGIVDTAVIGQTLSAIHIGAVGMGAMIFSFVYWAFGFLRMGTSGYIAQAFGREELDEMTAIVIRACLLALVIGLLLWIFQDLIEWTVFMLMQGSEQVESLAGEYYNIRIISAPVVLLNYVILGFMLGTQRMRTALALQIILNGTNILLDVILVMYFNYGIEGVAVATVCSEILAAIIGLIIIAKIIGFKWTSVDTMRVFNKQRIVAMFVVNTNIFIRTLCLMSCFFYFTSLSSGISDTILAVNTILLNMVSLMAYSLDGFADTVEALAGNAYGRRNVNMLRNAVKYTMIWSIIVALAYTMIYALFGHLVINLMTKDDVVIGIASSYLIWVIAIPLIGVWSYLFDGLYTGVTHSKEMRNGMIISLILFVLLVNSFIDMWFNHGLWLAFIIFLGARGIVLALWYPRIEKAIHDQVTASS